MQCLDFSGISSPFEKPVNSLIIHSLANLYNLSTTLFSHSSVYVSRKNSP